MPTVYTEDQDLSCDAALVQERTVCCVDATGRATVVPLDRVERVDADADLLIIPPELPEWFFGGGEYGFVETEAFPDLKRHLEDIDRQQH